MDVTGVDHITSKYKTLDELRSKCLECKMCPLSEGRTNLVFGVGDEDADIMFIGEGPGEQEDLRGEPFVGRAGVLLDKFLGAVDLDRTKTVYIANIVKCRPPHNRDPLPEEQKNCMTWLREQVKLINPKIIVCLGRIVAKKIIDPEFMVTKQHGQFIQKGNLLMMGTFHPAALLRNPNNKPAAFDDFLKLRDKLIEISE